MIRFGPAGIPLSCKGRTLQDGIEDVHNLSLSALEIQMVRASSYTRCPDDEEIGMTLKDIEEGFVIEIIRDGEPISDPDEPIDEDDDLIYMPSGVSDTFGELYGIGDMAKRLDVNMSIHTPYYMDLGSNTELTDVCLDSIRHAGLIMDALDGDIVVTSLGLYDDKMDREEVDNNIFENVAMLMDWWQGNGLKPRLGVEITGQQDVFGSLDQVLDLCDSFKGAVVPVLNFAQYQSRTKGSLITSTDFADLIAQFVPYSKDGVYSSFSNVEFDTEGNEKWLTPLKKGDLKFERLAECLADMMPEITLISSSPLLEHDAVYMRTLTERVLSKKAAKYLKDKKKSDEAAAIANGTLAPADPNDEPEA